MTQTGPEWRAFEQAVAAFLQALDPTAKVRHDARTPDRHTGIPRQRDVWIDTLFGGHLKIVILVSCKRKKARLNQQDIDAFNGELQASGAHKGVLYAYGGFSKPALAKAEALGISCCTLYEDRPADIPEMLAFTGYCYREQCRIELSGAGPDAAELLPEVLDELLLDRGALRPVLGVLVSRFSLARDHMMARLTYGDRPTWFAEIDLEATEVRPALRLRLESGWAVYRARFDSWLLNGSYSITDQNFSGSFSTPWIDQHSVHPGPGWERIDAEEVVRSGNVMSAYSHGGDTEADIRAHYAAAD